MPGPGALSRTQLLVAQIASSAANSDLSGNTNGIPHQESTQERGETTKRETSFPLAEFKHSGNYFHLIFVIIMESCNKGVFRARHVCSVMDRLTINSQPGGRKPTITDLVKRSHELLKILRGFPASSCISSQCPSGKAIIS